jgi:hypothetical protein
MKRFDVRVEVLLEPVGTPDVVVTCNGCTTELIVTESTWVNFTFTNTAGVEQLTVTHRNRKDNDGVTAVIIKSVKFNDIESPKIVYQGIYYPAGKESRCTEYIDFNGVWVLDFTLPIYTWLHQTLGLGWIYN